MVVLVEVEADVEAAVVAEAVTEEKREVLIEMVTVQEIGKFKHN